MNKDSKYQEVNTRKFLSDTKYYEGYSRFREMDGRYETWDESVDRVLETHKRKYSHLIDVEKFNSLIDEVEIAYKNKTVLGAQRALQFGGDQLLKHEFRIYNCASSYVDRASFFGECFYVLLAGAGAGISVQKQHVNKLPEIRPRNKRPKTHIIQDSIEGWATSLDVLLSSFFVGGGVHPEYEGKKVYFDSSEVRGKGELISGGFKAPGPEPLVKALNLIERLLNDIAEEGILRPIDAYDIVMHFADAVLSGGVRRSATLCVFSKGDEEMMKAKTGNWFVDNPQRARSNNSVLLLRNELTFDEFKSYMLKVQQFGEPGFIFTDDLRHLYNPCITGDTLINTSKGLRRADSLINIPFEAVVNGKNYKSEGFIKTNTEFVNHIKTFSGHNISITNNHKMKILENGKEIWRRCDELKIGDKMVVSDDVKKENYTRVGEIVEIIRSKKPYKVYDCSVDEIHCFEANGLISHNCVEISMYPQIDGISGWESCNLSEINGAKCITKEKFYEACRTASIVGTLQAGYTDFKFLSEASKKIIEREALIGVSITGYMNNPNILFDDETLRKGARIVKETNREVAKILGINPAARTTCTKPSGNACTGFDTKIKTNKGIMSLEEIFKYCNNDIDIKNLSPDSWVEVKNKLYVFDENNDIRGISNLYNNGIKEVYEIEFEDEKTYSFTGEHKLKTITGWKKVKDINKNDEIVSF